MAGYSTTLRNAQNDAITAAIGNGGKGQLYDGARPATGGPATTKLAEFTFGTPFSGASVAGVMSPTLPADTTGLAVGSATWGRITTAAGAFVADVSVGTSGAEWILNTTSITIGVTVSLTAMTVTAGNA